MRFALAAAAVLLTACGRTPSPQISVIGTPDATAVEVRGLPSRDVAALSSFSRDQWAQVFRVHVSGTDGPPMAGDYRAGDGRIRFTPMYGFDKGRTFVVTFAWGDRAPLQHTFTVAAPAAASQTSVRLVYPSGSTLPENMLRFYVQFSAPMGRGAALEHIRLEDDSGKTVVDPFLPVEAEFWSPERTRFTLFFDPGRVKRGIKPNRDMGRALVAGKRYALVIDARWIDGNGQPLKEEHRHTFTAGPAIERAIETSAWKIATPRAGTREPVTVTFPWPLDIGLLQRALGIERGGAAVAGEVSIDGAETRWTFTPRDAWTAGPYTLVALTLLEDPAGNRIGRAFEVTRPVDERERVEIGFAIK